MLSRSPSPTGAERLSISVEPSSGIVVVIVGGEIDAYTSPQLRSCLLDQVGRRKAGTVAIDLASVTFCDSTALGVLVGTHRRLAREGRRLEVRAARPAIRHLFEVSGLDQVLNVD